ncbi:unnamed protein product [Peniophora sp. CBMAI 1063]|nr:unnamed protein product [Peniophora sp. CBMAI 1063]
MPRRFLGFRLRVSYLSSRPSLDQASIRCRSRQHHLLKHWRASTSTFKYKVPCLSHVSSCLCDLLLRILLVTLAVLQSFCTLLFVICDTQLSPADDVPSSLRL